MQPDEASSTNHPTTGKKERTPMVTATKDRAERGGERGGEMTDEQARALLAAVMQANPSGVVKVLRKGHLTMIKGGAR